MFFSFVSAASTLTIPLAEQSTATNSYSWGIVIFCVVVGLIAALRPSHRTTEVKRPKVIE
jgi:hypothetical protein